MNSNPPPLVVVVGPTAVGKTGLALALAQQFGGEIVNADSRQIYRFMDIGTAKPTLAERDLAVHHLLDFVAPDEDFSLATYQVLAYEAIAAIHQRHQVPFLAGGTGQYVRAVVDGWQVPRVAPNLALREELANRAAAEGIEGLFRQLQELDPPAAGRIDPRNVRRVIRALEVIRATGRRFSEVQQKVPPPYRILTLGLTTERAQLYERIDRRVDMMIQQGLVGEVEGLLERGYGLDLPSMSSLGYRQIGEYLKGQCELTQAVAETKFETHRYARQQYAWFRLKDPNILWLDAAVPDTEGEASQAVESFLS